MYHAVHAADVHEHAVAGHGLDGAGVVLALFDVVPHLSGGSGTGLGGHSADRTNHAAARAVDLRDAQLHLGLDHVRQVGSTGLAGLGSRNEHPDPLDIGHQTALVLLGNNALKHLFALHSALNRLPVLLDIQTFLRQANHAIPVADLKHISLDLLAHLGDILHLDIRIVAQLRQRDVAGILDAQLHLDLGGRDGNDSTSDLLPAI